MTSTTKTTATTPSFIDNPVATGRPGAYRTVTVDVGKVLRSWQESLFSYEWMMPDGRLKPAEDLPAGERDRRRAVEDRLQRGEPLERPVLGIGILDNVEIGAGKAIFLTLAAGGLKTLPVHIPISHADEFADFIKK